LLVSSRSSSKQARSISENINATKLIEQERHRSR
jgi:hypothetical protein